MSRRVGLDELRAALLVAYLWALPISVAIGNVLGVLLLVAAWWRPRQAWTRLRQALPGAALWGVLALPIVVLLFALPAEPGQGETWDVVTKQRKLLLLGLAPIACRCAVTFAHARFAVWGAAGLLAATSWVFMALDIGLHDDGLHAPFDPEVPVTITHNYQNFFVGFAAVWLGWWLFANRARLSGRGLAAGGAALALMAGSVLFVVSGRGGQVAFLVMAAWAVFWSLRRARWPAVAVITLATAAALALSPQAQQRWSALADSWNGATTEIAMSGTLRLMYLRHTATIIGEAPVLGHGTGQYAVEFARVSGLSPDDPRFTYHPHADLLFYWSEAGLAGLAAVLALYLTLWLLAGRLDAEARIVLRALVAGFAVCGLTHAFLLDYVSGAYFYSVAGLLLATAAWRSAPPTDP